MPLLFIVLTIGILVLNKGMSGFKFNTSLEKIIAMIARSPKGTDQGNLYTGGRCTTACAVVNQL